MTSRAASSQLKTRLDKQKHIRKGDGYYLADLEEPGGGGGGPGGQHRLQHGLGLNISHLTVRTVLLKGEAEVVEDAALGGDALGALGRPVTQPGKGLVTFVTHLVTIVTRLLTLSETPELHPELPVPGLRKLLDLGQDVRVRD